MSLRFLRRIGSSETPSGLDKTAFHYRKHFWDFRFAAKLDCFVYREDKSIQIIFNRTLGTNNGVIISEN